VQQMLPRVHALQQVLSDDERARAGTYAFADDARRFVVARGTLRCLLGACLDVAPTGIRFRTGPRGKPALRAVGRPPLHFNVAHSGDAVLIAIARRGPLGVDVERIRADVDTHGIARRFFSPAEIAALDALGPATRRHAFFACWVRKEAYLKARGDGLARPLGAFSVSVEPDAAVVRLSDDAAAAVWSLRSVDAGAGYAAALAVEGPDPPFSLYQATHQDPSADGLGTR
jgi:4'-phosphopantetheinyl transferase